MEEIIAALNAAGIRYLVVGGQAVRLHGLPRFSLDLDLLVPPRDARNFEKLNRAMGPWLGEPVVPLGNQGENFVQTFQTPCGVVQFHLGLPGIASMEAAEADAATLSMENGTPCRVLSARDLLRSKEAVGRDQDQLDIEFLREKLRNQERRGAPPR